MRRLKASSGNSKLPLALLVRHWSAIHEQEMEPGQEAPSIVGASRQVELYWQVKIRHSLEYLFVVVVCLWPWTDEWWIMQLALKPVEPLSLSPSSQEESARETAPLVPLFAPSLRCFDFSASDSCTAPLAMPFSAGAASGGKLYR